MNSLGKSPSFAYPVPTFKLCGQQSKQHTIEMVPAYTRAVRFGDEAVNVERYHFSGISPGQAASSFDNNFSPHSNFAVSNQSSTRLRWSQRTSCCEAVNVRPGPINV